MRQKTAFLVIFPLILLFSACADKYQSYKSNYTFKSDTGIPDYSNLDYWAAHPDKWDPSDSVPAPLRSSAQLQQEEPRDSDVDVFFIHPTTFTKKKFSNIPNANIDDDYLNAKTDYSSILLQASAFNQHARVFAPRYRQAHIGNFYSKDTSSKNEALAVAYTDIREAFLYSMKHYNNGRPIIIAGHSQGALMDMLLLREFFENKPLSKQLVAAYIVGWPLSTNWTPTIKACEDSLQTGCACSWSTFKRGYKSNWIREQKGPLIVTNPISWKTNSDFINRSKSKGAVLMDFNKIYHNVADAQVKNGVVYTRKPHFPMSFLYRKKNYHVGDINLYYMDIRNNVANRISAYRQLQSQQ